MVSLFSSVDLVLVMTVLDIARQKFQPDFAFVLTTSVF
jgi:hypothetical protein